VLFARGCPSVPAVFDTIAASPSEISYTFEGRTMTQRRRPKGYLGIDHGTIGSDIVAVIKILKLPEQILGVEDATRLSSIEPRGWYPIELMLD
jgi:hypothetical protein